MRAEEEDWREVSITYATRPDLDIETTEEAMIEAALRALGCDCTTDHPDGYECKAGDWVAGAHPLRLDQAVDWEQAVAEVRARYPEDVFPHTSNGPDARAGTLARLVCDEIVRLAKENADA